MKISTIIALLFFSLLGVHIHGQSFLDINVQIPGIQGGKVIWGDYDNDGDLDCFITGVDFFNLTPISGLYQNNNGSFVLVNNNLTNNLNHGDAQAAFGDYDNDGDLDLIFNSDIYNNQNGIFTNINANLLYIAGGEASWGDYDNDNDLDLLIVGNDLSSSSHSIIYQNTNGVFTNINAGLTGTQKGNGEWGDYDNDGDLDILLCGKIHNNTAPPYITYIYENNSNVFSLVVTFTGISYGTAKWGDYDNDNDLDVLLCGDDNNPNPNSHYTALYRNNGNNSFSNTGINFTNISSSYGDFVDYNDDGKLDIMISGFDTTGSSITKIYINNGNNTFNSISHNFIGLASGSFDWGDYDADGKIDLITAGVNNTNGYSFNVKIYKQEITTSTFDKIDIIDDAPTVYPNPTSGAISITLEESKSGSLRVLNSLGQIVLEEEFEATEELKISLDGPSGLYFLQVEVDGEIITKKVVKE